MPEVLLQNPYPKGTNRAIGWARGWHDFRNGLTAQSNPYVNGMHRQWAEGWAAARDQAKRESEGKRGAE